MFDFLKRPFPTSLRDAYGTVKALAGVAIIGFYLWGFLANLQLALLIGIPFAMIATGAWWWVDRYYVPRLYEIASAETTLVVQRKGAHHSYKRIRHFEIVARRNGLRLLEYRLSWTGQASKGLIGPLESMNPDHCTYAAPREDEDKIRYYWLYLGRTLAKGDTTRVHVEQTFEDDLQEMQPYHEDGGAGSHTKIRKLKVVTRFPKSQDPVKVTGHIWHINRKAQQPRSAGRIDVQRVVDVANRYVDYIVEVEKPKRFHGYGVRWQYYS
ncbi:hypothetical protein ACIGXA_11405 [Streptomyces fildesensis]|uniref:SMODS-associating 2TM beta-strand rich effector domain-containing protein n=1 Tax=Streptomyces fildesensis TaxID=375757 RepID=A0ABW8C3X0_9ACTN